jgi:hypothetical protein
MLGVSFGRSSLGKSVSSVRPHYATWQGVPTASPNIRRGCAVRGCILKFICEWTGVPLEYYQLQNYDISTAKLWRLIGKK